MENWKEYKLEDISKSIFAGGDASKFPCKKYKTDIYSIPMYANAIENDGLYGYTNTAIVHEPAVTIAARGAGTGNVIYRNKPFTPIVRLISIIPNNNVNPLFLACILQLKKLSGDGSAIPQLTVPEVKKMSIKLPSLNTQNRVANFIEKLNQKIALNRRINGNLEQQAQALFKAWFVDFEPFKDGKFVDSELGRIPEGWKVGQLDELVEIKYGKDHKKLLPGNIPVYGSGGIMRHVNMPIYEKESVLIPRKGSLNNVLYVNHPFWTVDTMFYTRMKINGIAKFIYLFISPIDLLSMNNGSAVPSMTTENLSKIRLVIPSKNIFDNFESLVAPSFDKIGSCNKEICKLSNLRDALLPKLLSGELSINTITE